MALTSASTITDAEAQLANNGAFDGDPTKAAAYAEAARWLIARRPLTGGGGGVSYNFANLAQLLAKAESIAATALSPAVSDRRRLGKLGVSHGA